MPLTSVLLAANAPKNTSSDAERQRQEAEAFSKFGTSDKAAAAKTANAAALAEAQKRLRAELESRLAEGARAWTAGDRDRARAEFRQVMAAAHAPAHFRSYAHLRLAQSFVADNDAGAAIEEYSRIAATDDYPEVHRSEAREIAAQGKRTQAGLPARDVEASRTTLPPIDAYALELFVAPEGSDSNPGTRAQPFATLEKARDTLRRRRAAGELPRGPVAVRLLPGTYERRSTFQLGKQDSGSPDAPVVYRADAAGTAVLYGGLRLTGIEPVTNPDVLARLPVEARGRVHQIDLRRLGVEVPALQERGYGVPVPRSTLELFFNHDPMVLARWPNEGFVNGGAIVQPGSKTTTEPSVFTYLDERHARWAGARDAWLYGYFAHGWADRTLKVHETDPVRRTVSCGPYRLLERTMEPVKWFNQGRIRYHVFNLLEELDRPGEWYIDRASRVLYLYPPADPATAIIEIGRLDQPMMVMRGAAHVRVEGLVFDLARANGIDWRDCENCYIAGCTVRRFAAEGIGIRGGRDCGIIGCNLYSLGRNATTVTGGDRTTLTPARHVVENCRMYEFGRLDHTYVPAVQLEGVGNRVAHNLFYECPSSVVRVEGNDHLLEYNRVHRVLLETEDQGAMELFGNATYRGVVFRFNYFSDIGGGETMKGPAGRAAIRFDDAISGMLVYGNVFRRAAQGFGAINMNGGRDNVIDSNLFVECERAITGGYNPRNVWWQKLNRTPGFMISELYLQRYPALRTVHDEPGLNQAWRNVFFRSGPPFTTYGEPSPEKFDVLANATFADTDPGFIDAKGGDFRLRSDTVLRAQVGGRAIPMDEIGPYADRYRASWPVEVKPAKSRPAGEH